MEWFGEMGLLILEKWYIDEVKHNVQVVGIL